MEEAKSKPSDVSIEDEKGGCDYKEFVSSEAIDDSIEATRTGKTVWLIASTVSMGGFLFGYDTGVISAVLANLGTDLGHKLSAGERQLITSITSGGALVGAVIAGLTSGKHGRKLEPMCNPISHTLTVGPADDAARMQSLSLVVAAIAFHWIPTTLDLTVQVHSINWAGILLVVTIILYVAFFAAGMAPISWVGTELLPLEVRALGTMINTVTCWGCNIIISSTFLSMMKSWTPSGAFGFYAGICFVGWIFVIFCYAEIHNMPLESVRVVYSRGFGIRYAKELQREMHEERRVENTPA